VLVVTFDPEQFNFITAGENSYFLLRFLDGSLVLYDDCCDHRGGPLHLGHWDDARKCLVCPWHGTKYSEKVLRNRAMPLIQRPGRVTAVLDTAPSTPIQLVKKTILAQPGW
jgi:phenylpropionate dioxygenase-like ring-hydroxylating dioxygenase large terminal subunit